MISLYLDNEIHEPLAADGYARRFLAPFAQEGTRAFVRNATCRVGVARIEGALLPFTVSEYLPDNSYICSPYNHYVTYAIEELRNLGNPPLEKAFAVVLRGLGRLLNPHAFDRIVMINNWLLSTNLYPALRGEGLAALVPALAERFPDHAILFRSLDEYRNPHLVAALSAAGGRRVFTRQIWYQDALGEAVQKSRDFRHDVKLLARAPYEVVPVEGTLSDTEIERLVTLYNQLYLEKYSRHNPQFTPRWVRLMLDERLMRFTLLARGGQIDGAYAYVERDGVMAQPFLGYDTTLPQETGLYRLLSAQILLEAQRTGHLCHASSGVGRFKRLRGAVGVEEYTLLFDGHLPPARRRAWRLIEFVLERIAVPMIQRGGY